MQTSSCKDFFKDISKNNEVQFYDILLYRCMQPFPLRNDMRRVRNEGDFAKNAPDLQKSLIKQMKFNTIQSYMQKTGLDAPTYKLDPSVLLSINRSMFRKTSKHPSPKESPKKKNWKVEFKKKLESKLQQKQNGNLTKLNT